MRLDLGLKTFQQSLDETTLDRIIDKTDVPIDHLDGILFLDRLTPLKRKLALKKWQKVKDKHAGNGAQAGG